MAVSSLPRWITPLPFQSRVLDSLGIGVQTELLGILLPGITTITPRVRYYAFYSWIFLDYERGNHPPGWSLRRFIRRREQLFVLANLAADDIIDSKLGLLGLAGQSHLASHLEAARGQGDIPLDASLDDYLSATGYDAYAGAFANLRIMKDQSDEDGSHVQLFEACRYLGEGFAEAIQSTEYAANRFDYDTADMMPLGVLEEYGQACHLDLLNGSADQHPTLEVLMGFGTPAYLSLDASGQTSGNMKGTFGLILDMVGQLPVAVDDDAFRQAIAYGLYRDSAFDPAPELKPFAKAWYVFQLREYAVYGIHGLWVAFLEWLSAYGPGTVEAYVDELVQQADVRYFTEQLGLSVSGSHLTDYTLDEWLIVINDVYDVEHADDWARTELHRAEHATYRLTNSLAAGAPTYALASFWLLSLVILRLNAWMNISDDDILQWTGIGGVSRLSLEQIYKDWNGQIDNSVALSDFLKWILKEHIVSQHFRTALDKWRNFGRDTFYLSYEDGRLECLRMDSNSFSASRFDQLRNIMIDLGLVAADSQRGLLERTHLGNEVLNRILAELHE